MKLEDSLPLIRHWQDYKRVKPLRRTAWQLIKNLHVELSRTEQFHASLGICPQGAETGPTQMPACVNAQGSTTHSRG